MVTLATGQKIAPRRHPARARRHPVLAQRRRVRARHVPRARRHGRDLSRVRGAGRSHRDVGRRDRAHLEDRLRSPARRSPISRRAAIYPAKHFVTSRPTIERAVGLIRAELVERLDELREHGQAARGAAARVAHQLRHRDDARDRHVRRHRELLAPPLRPRGGRAAGVPLRLLPRGFPRRRRRVARHAAADRRHVQRRPRAQAHARRLRIPAAERARQPAADVRRVPVAHAARALRLGDAGRDRAAAVGRRRRRADHSAHRARRSGDRGAPGARPGGRPARTRSACASDAASACSSRRSPSAWPKISPTTCSRWACACATCTPTSTRSSAWRSCAACGSASSTCWSASTCCAKGSTCPRCRWSRSSTPTRKDSCAAIARSSRPSGRAARHVERTRDLLRRSHHRLDAALHRRDQAPPRDPARVQRRARHHADVSVVKSIDQVRFITRVADARERARGASASRSPSRSATYASEMDHGDAHRSCSRRRCRRRPRISTSSRRRAARPAVRGEGARNGTRRRTDRRSRRGSRARAHPSAALMRRAPPHRSADRARAGTSRSRARSCRVGRALRPVARTPPLVVTSPASSGPARRRSCRRSAAATGVTTEVTSPTYALVHEYRRARSPSIISICTGSTQPDQLTNLGWDDIAARARADSRRVAGARRRRAFRPMRYRSISSIDPAGRGATAASSRDERRAHARARGGDVDGLSARCSTARDLARARARSRCASGARSICCPRSQAALGGGRRRRRRDLARIVCGAGPGSFTSLRVAASLAKGTRVRARRCRSSRCRRSRSSCRRPVARRWELSRGARCAARRCLCAARICVARRCSDASSRPRATRARDAARARRWRRCTATVIGPGRASARTAARGSVVRLERGSRCAPVSLAAWEPDYGRLAEAQVKWEQAHGRPLPVACHAHGPGRAHRRGDERAARAHRAAPRARGGPRRACSGSSRQSFADPWSRSAFVELLDDPRVVFLLAEAGGAVRGYVVAWFVLDEGEIGNLAVHAMRGDRGLARSLLDGAIAAVRESRRRGALPRGARIAMPPRARSTRRGDSPRSAGGASTTAGRVEDALVLRLELSEPTERDAGRNERSWPRQTVGALGRNRSILCPAM